MLLLLLSPIWPKDHAIVDFACDFIFLFLVWDFVELILDFTWICI